MVVIPGNGISGGSGVSVDVIGPPDGQNGVRKVDEHFSFFLPCSL